MSIKLLKVIAIFFFQFFSHLSFAQMMTTLPPTNPGGLISMRIPFSLMHPKKGEMTVTMNSSEGNVWLPEVTILEPKELTLTQKALLDSQTYRERALTINNLNIPNRAYYYKADGTVQSQTIYISDELTDHSEIGISFNVAVLSRGTSVIESPVSDEFIESLHSIGIGRYDNFGRRLYPFNQAEITFKDSEGKGLSLHDGDLFLGTFDLHYIDHIELVHEDQNRRVKVLTLNLGAYAGIPMNQYLNELPVGMSAQLVSSIRLGSNTSLISTIGGSYTRNDLIRWGTPIALVNENSLYQLEGYLGVSIHHRSGLITTYGIQHEEYSMFAKPIPEMGLIPPVSSTNKTPTWWELTPDQFGGKASGFKIPNDQYFDLVVGVQKKNMAVNFFLKEDLKVNNAPDLQLGIQLIKRFRNKSVHF